MILRSEYEAGSMDSNPRPTNSNWRIQSARTLLLITALSASLYADDGRSRGCSEATIKGTFGYTISGTRPVPNSPGQTEPHIGVGIRHYDGEGNFTQTDTTKGAVAGAATDITTSGTYSVNPDCTGSALLAVPNLPAPVETRFVVVKKGDEIHWIVLSPAPVMITGHAVRR